MRKDPCQRQKVPHDHIGKLHTHSPANPPQLTAPGNCSLSNRSHHERFVLLSGAKDLKSRSLSRGCLTLDLTIYSFKILRPLQVGLEHFSCRTPAFALPWSERFRARIGYFAKPRMLTLQTLSTSDFTRKKTKEDSDAALCRYTVTRSPRNVVWEWSAGTTTYCCCYCCC
jgi:hypothetical protein